MLRKESFLLNVGVLRVGSCDGDDVLAYLTLKFNPSVVVSKPSRPVMKML